MPGMTYINVRIAPTYVILELTVYSPSLTVAISRVPKSEAARLPNKTYPVENEKDEYFVGLDVFHQLHCLVRDGDASSEGEQ